MRPSRGMGDIAPSKMPKAKNVVKRDGNEPVKAFKQGGKVKKLGIGGALGLLPMRAERGELPKNAGFLAGIAPGLLYKDYAGDMEEEAEKEKQRLIAEQGMKQGGKVNEAGNYTKPGLRKRIFNSVKAAAVQGTGAGQWSARKAQLMAKRYKAAGGGYRD